MLMCRNVAAGIGSNEQGEYCRAALQRSDRKEPRYKWPTLLYFTRQLPGPLWADAADAVIRRTLLCYLCLYLCKQ